VLINHDVLRYLVTPHCRNLTPVLHDAWLLNILTYKCAIRGISVCSFIEETSYNLL
jgi:hypothetical protein